MMRADHRINARSFCHKKAQKAQKGNRVGGDSQLGMSSRFHLNDLARIRASQSRRVRTADRDSRGHATRSAVRILHESRKFISLSLRFRSLIYAPTLCAKFSSMPLSINDSLWRSNSFSQESFCAFCAFLRQILFCVPDSGYSVHRVLLLGYKDIQISWQLISSLLIR